MAYNLHVIKTTDFVRLDAHGKPELEQSRKALEQLAKACVSRGATAALVDIRELQGQLTLTEIFELICAFPEMGFREEHRVAVLHRFGGADHAEFFAMCASTRGWHVRAFFEFEEAMEWFEMELPVN